MEMSIKRKPKKKPKTNSGAKKYNSQSENSVKGI